MKEIFISEYIDFHEAIHSNTATRNGIINLPNKNQLRNMRIIGLLVFDPLRSYFNRPVIVNSFFRVKELNTIIGGSSTSQHCNGEAIDLKAGKRLLAVGITNKDLFNYIRNYLEFDQLIWEFGDRKAPKWVHVSYNNLDNGIHNRKQILVAYKEGNKTKYTSNIVYNKDGIYKLNGVKYD